MPVLIAERLLQTRSRSTTSTPGWTALLEAIILAPDRRDSEVDRLLIDAGADGER